ncbi:hypothetical protein B9Z19DRAFT_1064035 [Tuber borchii]|uniref:Uncharacterized protein n=1 Tax=Tuber borchii TaxID=42251 RepID=A0A2T6ZW27_TUBBO|nr:hypothetical protein B9Z19DRAFT_1064035 [Tuber borchii]
MSIQSTSIPGSAHNQQTTLIPSQLGVMEAARAVWDLVGEEHINDFAVVGGAALLFHGSDIKTEDTDLAITGKPFDKFCQLVKNDSRFVEDPYGGPWRYHATFGFDVLIDFLDKLGGGGYLPEMTGHCLIDGVPVATLVDLALLKGAAWVDRDEKKDLAGFDYALRRMAEAGLSFRGSGEIGKGILDKVVVKLQSSEKGKRVLGMITSLS